MLPFRSYSRIASWSAAADSSGFAREAQDLGEIGEGVRAEIEEVGARGDRRRFAAEALGLFELTPAGQQLRPHAPPTDLRVGVLRHS